MAAAAPASARPTRAKENSPWKQLVADAVPDRLPQIGLQCAVAFGLKLRDVLQGMKHRFLHEVVGVMTDANVVAVAPNVGLRVAHEEGEHRKIAVTWHERMRQLVLATAKGSKPPAHPRRIAIKVGATGATLGSSTAENWTIRRGLPSSRTVKSADVNPRTGRRWASSTETSSCTASRSRRTSACPSGTGRPTAGGGQCAPFQLQ